MGSGIFRRIPQITLSEGFLTSCFVAEGWLLAALGGSPSSRRQVPQAPGATLQVPLGTGGRLAMQWQALAWLGFACAP